MHSLLEAAVMLVGLAAPFESANEQRQDKPPRTQLARIHPSGSRLLDQPARLVVQDLPLVSALARLHQASGVNLLFSPSILPETRLVTCDCEALTLRQALERLLAGTKLQYAEVAGHVIVEPRSEPKLAVPHETAATVSALTTRLGDLVSASAKPELEAQQQSVVTGVVVSERGVAVPGATVTLVGTAAQVVTDGEGRFRLEAPANQEVTLRVTAIGYRPLTQRVLRSTQVRLVLNEAPVNLDEIVVTGTSGGAARREIGNSVATVRVSEIAETAPVQNIGQILNGRAPGVVINSPTGFAMAPARVLIRGRSSLSLGIAPLIYVDGVRVNNAQSGGAQVPGTRLNDFDPSQIESIEIIKGPAAATLYGTEASNGVIQIITKKGRQGDTQVAASIRQGAVFLANPDGRWPINYFEDPVTGGVREFNIVEAERNRGTPMFRTGHQQGYSINASGGSDRVQYFTSAEYDRNEGSVKADWYERFGGRLNLTVTPSSKWDLDGRLGFSLTRAEYTDFWFTFSSLITDPLAVDTPRRGFFLAPPEVVFRQHPLTQDVNHFTAGVSVRNRPTGWLSQRLQTGIDISVQDDIDLFRNMPPEDAQFFFGSTPLGRKQVRQSNVMNVTVDYSATATLPVTKSLRSATTGGIQYYRNRTSLLEARGEGFPSPDVTSIGGAATTFGGGDLVENITVGAFFQEQLSWKDRMFLTAAVRGDDNSSFGKDFDFVVYPKFSASWVIAEEPWWKVSFIDKLRLRAAWGKSGQQPAAFASLRTFQPTTALGAQTAVTPQFVGNPSLEPEKSQELELGFEAALFNQRLGVEFTFYHENTKDAILARNVAPSTGFPGTQFVNAGEVRNRGVELLLNASIIQNDHLAFDLGFNFSYNQNQVLSLGLAGIKFLESGIGAVTRFQPGFPVFGIFGRRVLSADVGQDGFPINVMCDGGIPKEPGGDPVLPGGAPVACDVAPRLFSGQVDPKFEGSVSPQLSLFQRRLNVRALLDFKTGHRNQSVFLCSLMGCEEEFFPERFAPEQAASVLLDLPDRAEAWQDVSFAKLREVSVSYQLPDSWARAIGAARAQVSVAGRNLAQWTRSRYKGMDPENNSIFLETAFFGGFDQDLPQARSFAMRLNLTF